MKTRAAAMWVITAMSLLWRRLPGVFREQMITLFFLLDSRGDAATGLRRMFILRDRLDWVTNERAMVYGKGVHPKHRLMCYHDFFVERIPEGSSVLDVGCGYGAVARSIAERVPGCHVTGVDVDECRLIRACQENNLPNLTFAKGDATCDLPKGNWEVIVMSNVLEHVPDRVGLLQAIVRQAHPSIVLIRVPMFEREWTIPMRKELGINYYSDAEHCIEHTAEEINGELAAAGLIIKECIVSWGEYWLACRPVARHGDIT